MDLISDIIENPNKLSNSFDNEESSTSSGSSNIVSIKCTKALFSKEGLKNNISSYIILIFIAHFLLSIILFMKCGYKILEQVISNILQEKEKTQKEKNKNNNQLMTSTNGNKKKGKKNFGRRKTHFPPRRYNLNFINNVNSKKERNKIKRKSSRSKSFLNKNNQSQNIISEINDNAKNKNRKNKLNFNKMKLSYNDYELNCLDYKQAILFDKRTCFEYYISLIKRKNIIIFSFFPINDFNSMIIKSCIFSLSFSIYYAVNFIFFTDNIMHKIYEEGGKYDIIFFLPKIAISFFASYYLTTIIQ